jgi:hypothetical protein
MNTSNKRRRGFLRGGASEDYLSFIFAIATGRAAPALRMLALEPARGPALAAALA